MKAAPPPGSRPHAPHRNPGCPRRQCPRPGQRRAGPAAAAGHHLPAHPRCAAAARLPLPALRQPDPARNRGGAGHAGRGRAHAAVSHRHGRRQRGPAVAAGRQPRAAVRRQLFLDPGDRPRLAAALGDVGHGGRFHRPGRGARRAAARYAAAVGRNTFQPAAQGQRHRRPGRHRPRRRRAPAGGQHLRPANPAAPAGAGRGRGDAVGHQVPGRPWRRDGRGAVVRRGR